MKGGQKFWIRNEGGQKISDFIFFISEIQCFLVFLWILGYFYFSGKRGAKIYFRTLIFSESLGKIKGHVKNLFRKYGVLRESLGIPEPSPPPSNK